MPAAVPPEEALPVDAVLPAVVESLRARPVLILTAPPGSGKTTRVPPALLAAGLAGDGHVLVLQPRRLAARMAARHVAAQRGERPGETVGWRVRFETMGGAATRLWYVTEGVLVRRLLADPTLRGVGAVVLDEFHERSLDGDLCLALLRRLQAGPRADLRLVVMSATLDAEGLAAALDAPVIRAEGRRFPVEVSHAPGADPRPLEVRVAEAVDRATGQGGGDLLVFLPGAAEIRRARDACADLAARRGLRLLPLHGDLPPDEQDRAVGPCERRKVVLSTNVAETSLTVPGVTVVVDSGLARRPSHSPWSGLPSLQVVKASRASAEQRAGRAGRTAPGRCIRLYTASDLQGRPEADAPEIVRADLAEAVLLLRAEGLDPGRDLPWLDAPPAAAREAADALLQRLGALDGDLRATSLGQRLASLPAHPRLGRLVAEAGARGDLEGGCLAAALLAERDVRRSTGTRRLLADAAPSAPRARPAGPADSRPESLAPPAALAPGYLDPVEAVLALSPGRAAPPGPASPGPTSPPPRTDACPPDLDPAAVAAVRRAAAALRSSARSAGLDAGAPPPADRARALTLALLAAFPDRVGRVRPCAAPGRARTGDLELAMSAGGTADLPPDALLPEGRLLVAADAAERTTPRGALLQVRAARVVEEDDLQEARFDDLRETTEVRRVAGSDRVESVRRLWYDRLLLEERPWNGAPPREAARVLAALAKERGWASLAADGEDPEHLLARLAFLAARRPDLALPVPDEAALDDLRAEACEGSRSLAEARRHGVEGVLLARLSPDQRRALDALAPPSVRLPGGRRLRLDYAPGQPPSAASRLQDFFGMERGPAVLGGAEPVVLHLRSPGGKDLQVTTDLASFWRAHYPALARELRRRYPRHAWPEDPARAAPPTPGKTRP